MIESLRVGTRRSPLARAQTGLVVRALARRNPGTRFTVVALATEGDRPRPTNASSWDFTDRIDRALESGDIDLAVHSAKDLPVRPLRHVAVAAYPTREDPRDCVILRLADTVPELPLRACLGSSSPRRRAQLKAWRPDLDIVEIRGNVGTRIEQMERIPLDGVVLAVAGLRRLGWENRITQRLPTSRLLPSPGQGALAVSARRDDRPVRRLAGSIDHFPTRAAVTAEQAVARALGGDCNLPLGALARVVGDRMTVTAAVFSSDGKRRIRVRREGPVRSAIAIGAGVGRDLSRLGGSLLRGGSAA